MRWALAALVCALSHPALAAAPGEHRDAHLHARRNRHRGRHAAEPAARHGVLVQARRHGGGETYSGQIKKVGTHTELDGKLVLIWVVMGPDEREMKPGMLEQSYVGELASSTDGKPQAPKMLVGNEDAAYGLRPMTDDSSESATGNVTVVELKVRSVPT